MKQYREFRIRIYYLKRRSGTLDLSRLQTVQNAAARPVICLDRGTHNICPGATPLSAC